MEQMYLFPVSWTDNDFESSIVKVQEQIAKQNRSFYAVYTKHKAKLETLEGIVEDLISYRVDRSQATGEF
jgi:hypothetical protein